MKLTPRWDRSPPVPGGFTTFCLKVFEALTILLSLQFVSMGELKDQSWYDLGQSLLPIET